MMLLAAGGVQDVPTSGACRPKAHGEDQALLYFWNEAWDVLVPFCVGSGDPDVLTFKS